MTHYLTATATQRTIARYQGMTATERMTAAGVETDAEVLSWLLNYETNHDVLLAAVQNPHTDEDTLLDAQWHDVPEVAAVAKVRGAAARQRILSAHV